MRDDTDSTTTHGEIRPGGRGGVAHFLFSICALKIFQTVALFTDWNRVYTHMIIIYFPKFKETKDLRATANKIGVGHENLQIMLAYYYCLQKNTTRRFGAQTFSCLC